MKETISKEQEEYYQNYLQFQLVKQQIDQISQNLQILHQQFAELETAKESVEEIKKTKKETKILSQLAAGIYCCTTLEENKEFLLNVGSNVVVKKNAEELINVLENQIREVEKLIIENENIFAQLNEQLNRIYQRLESLKNVLQIQRKA